MNYTRITAHITLICITPLTPLPVLFFLFFVYGIFFPGIELLLLAAMIDVYFGTVGYPLVTAVVGVGLVLILWLRPQFSFYNDEYV